MKKSAIVIAIGFMAAVFACAAFNYTPAQKLYNTLEAVKQLYVDSVDEQKLAEDAIRGMLEKLDPHSAYSTAEETRELNEPLEGNFSGVGITFNMNQDTLYVISTVAGGPSERVGILAGDRIISVNDTSIAGVNMKNTDIMKRLRGPKGTDVDVRVLRHGSGAATDTIDFLITRDDIPIFSVDAAYMVDDKTGYIRISRFAAETANEVREAMKDLNKQGMKQLILDLTDNGGGFLNAATDVVGELLKPGETVVYTEGLNSPRHDFFSRPGGKKPLFADGRLVVMVNQYSASASEITSGAVQDWDRGVIVGRRTFGKGLVQRPIPFPDGSMIRLTIAHYYTPTGRDIQKPYTKGKNRDYAQDMLHRLQSGELMHADSVKYVDSLAVPTLRLHRTIYGGGGISPDRFVPLDTTIYSKYYRDLMAKGTFNRYAIKYVDENRNAIKKKYAKDTDFVDNFEVTEAMLADLCDMGRDQGVEFVEEDWALSRDLVASIVKSLIGRDIYDQATYFKVYNRTNPIFLEALDIINSESYDQILSPSSTR